MWETLLGRVESKYGHQKSSIKIFVSKGDALMPSMLSMSSHAAVFNTSLFTKDIESNWKKWEREKSCNEAKTVEIQKKTAQLV